MLDIICLGIIKYLPSTNLFRSEEIIYIYLDMSRIHPLLYFLRSEESHSLTNRGILVITPLSFRRGDGGEAVTSSQPSQSCKPYHS